MNEKCEDARRLGAYMQRSRAVRVGLQAVKTLRTVIEQQQSSLEATFQATKGGVPPYERGTLRELCSGAARARIPILLDAEQTHRQPAIRLIARELAREFNTGSPLVYDTHQAYLRGAADRVTAELEHARRGGYTFAVKLVRGAYRVGEAQRDAGVLQPSKRHTDDEYDRCAQMLLDAATDETPVAAVLLATHNRASVDTFTSRMLAEGVAANHPRIHFAQILGMADGLTLGLGQAGFNAHKLVPYGKLSDVLPWLLRRLDENHDALGAAAYERPLLRAEWRRRAGACFTSWIEWGRY